ncbi:uncharacterized protein LOC143851303 [Tasmannia lanceolata]|uniref:uncharacterized protein LOC143851303 n=1 Tax=Tasmannia lanceolata TaxID=3420 RepID=UPI00406416DB
MLYYVMESWRYGSEGKGFGLSDEMVSASNALSRTRKEYTSWDLKIPRNYDDAMPNSMELGFMDSGRKLLLDDPTRRFLGSNIGNGKAACSSSHLINGNAFSIEKTPNSRDLSLIDLKLGRLVDYKDANNSKSSKEIQVFSSIVSSMPARKARSTNANARSPCCQVHGCNMDLSSSKDYHKRHKVCEIHSKTAKVIVNGIEQRFCQQCSRFHLLAEFDDGKRSCRKRLAGHNERRRKPQLDHHPEKTGKLLSSFHGNRFPGTSLPARTSFICQDIFPSGVPKINFENKNWCKRVKLEDKEVYNTEPPMPVMNGHLLPKSFLPSYGMDKHFSFFHGIDTEPESICYENNNQYAQDLTGSHSILRTLFRSTSSGHEEFPIFDTTSSVQSLSGVSDSGCALSLLSSQSQNSSARIPMARPMFNQGVHAHYNMGQFGQFQDKLLRVSSQASTSMASNKVSSYGMSSVKDDCLGGVPVSDSSNAVEFEIQADVMFQGSDFINAKDPISREHGHTVNLLQLSSQLQNTENQSHPVHLKQESGAFCYLPIT